ncbi:MAG: hypothetical protein Q4D21_06970 [Phascolarctobacterium sp.]|nr:hypothetical protein [Phascolarctobacterium sp.]
MIRTLNLVCAECKETYNAEGLIYYREDFISRDFQDVELICPKCHQAWIDKWKVKSAEFKELHDNLYVNLELEDGTYFEEMDCTPMDEHGLVALGVDSPEEAQKAVYEIYHAWDLERKANILKHCNFKDEFMNTTFSCETFSGEKYEDVAFRFTMHGDMETAVPVPDYIKEQVAEAYEIYIMIHKNK